MDANSAVGNWQYAQTTGVMLAPDGTELALGYSGNGAAMDDPASQGIEGHGPVPQGEYTIGDAFTDGEKGPLVMRLTPGAANEMFGRSGFLIHGDNAALNHTASDGCIILPHAARLLMAVSNVRRLTVTA